MAKTLAARTSCKAYTYRVAWPAVMKGWEQWRDVYSAEGQLLFAGLRAKVSVFHGQMTRIVPHTTTGNQALLAVPTLPNAVPRHGLLLLLNKAQVWKACKC